MILLILTLTDPASAVEWNALAGVRNSFSEDDTKLEGPRGGLLARAGRWSAELTGYARVVPYAPSELDTALYAIASQTGVVDVAVPTDVDLGGAAFLAGWHPATPTDPDVTWYGGPVLLAGVEARAVDRYVFNGATDAPSSSRLVAGPVAGVAVDARLGLPLGARIAVLDRMRVDRDITWTGDGLGDGLRLFHDPTLTLDLTWALGGAR